MTCGKIFRRALFAIFGVIFVLNAAVVGAKIQMYTASGEDYPSEVESMDISKQRALDKAIKKAKKEAGVYLKTYSRTVNAKLTDDDIIAITSNSYKIVGEPKFTKSLKQTSDETTIIVWKVTVDVNVDDSEIQSWLKRDDKNKSTIISQTQDALKASEENDKKIEDLRAKYNRATSQAEKDRIRKQMNDADREFLANQKLEEGDNFYYAKNYEGALKLYNEAIKFKPDYANAYENIGDCYYMLDKYDLAIKNYNRAVNIEPNNAKFYKDMGNVYLFHLDDIGKGLENYNKAIALDPNNASYYSARAALYERLDDYSHSIRD